MMNGRGKSDRSTVPRKPPNNVGQPTAEAVEGKDLAKGNSPEGNAFRTQRRRDARSALERVRRVARKDRKKRFTALLHHVYDLDRLRDAYFALKRDASAGVDGETWRHYGEALEGNLADLAERLKRGAYHAKPVRRVHIPKPEVKAELRSRMHDPVPEQGAYLRSVIDGHFRYYGVPGNGAQLGAFRHHVIWLWRNSLRRRSQTHHITWERIYRYVARWIPPVRIHHPWPSQRYGVTTRGKSRMR